MVIETNKKNFLENFFFLAFTYLVQISLFTSFFQCIHYLIYNYRSSFVTLLGFTSLIITLIFFIFDKKFKENYITLIFNEITMKYLVFLQKRVSNLTENHSFLLFVLFHSYLCLSLLHFIMLLSQYIDPLFEVPFQILNLFRLLFFPMILFSYALAFLPRNFSMQGPFDAIVNEAVTKMTKDVITWLQENGSYQKNPKTSALILMTTVGAAGLISNAADLRRLADEVTEITGLNLKDPPVILADDPQAVLMLNSLLKAAAKTRHSPIGIALSDLEALLGKKPTMRDEFLNTLPDLKTKIVLLQRQAEIKAAQELSMSRLASESTERELPDTSVTLKTPSILEYSIF